MRGPATKRLMAADYWHDFDVALKTLMYACCADADKIGPEALKSDAELDELAARMRERYGPYLDYVRPLLRRLSET